jgi:hypothetical protein
MPPRQIATAAQARFGASAQALHDWLLQMERWRYSSGQASSDISLLRAQLRTLHWPEP